jgi:hypothetical protein
MVTNRFNNSKHWRYVHISATVTILTKQLRMSTFQVGYCQL